jgi:hypothetical protein
MTPDEAHDVTTLLRWLGAHPLDGQLLGDPVTDTQAADAFRRLAADAAHAQHLHAGDIDAAWQRLRTRVHDHASDAAAQAVCHVLAGQVARGFSLISFHTYGPEFRRWADLQEAP